MPTLSDLTADDQAQLADFMRAFRPSMGEISRVFAKLSRLEDAWSGGISALVTGLDANSVVSPGSDLAGAAPLAKESVTATMNDFAAAMSAFNAAENRQRYIAAAGLTNTL